MFQWFQLRRNFFFPSHSCKLPSGGIDWNRPSLIDRTLSGPMLLRQAATVWPQLTPVGRARSHRWKVPVGPPCISRPIPDGRWINADEPQRSTIALKLLWIKYSNTIGREMTNIERVSFRSTSVPQRHLVNSTQLINHVDAFTDEFILGKNRWNSTALVTHNILDIHLIELQVAFNYSE